MKTPTATTTEFAFLEPANTSEALILCIASTTGDGKIKVDDLMYRAPPFAHGPAKVIGQFCDELRKRGLKEVGAHRFASQWARHACTKQGVAFLRFDSHRPEIFGHFFGLLDAGDVILPKDEELQRQMHSARLRRGGADDRFSAVAGAVVRARVGMIGAGTLGKSSQAGTSHAA